MNEVNSTPVYPSKEFSIRETLEGKNPKFSNSGLDKLTRVSRPKLESVSLRYFRRQYYPPDLTRQRRFSLVDSLDLSVTARQKITRKTLQNVFTFKEYMEYALYDQDFGYSTTSPGVNSNFNANPMINSSHYGAALAEVVIQLWAGMVGAGTFLINDRVDICELGGGNGSLAKNFMSHAERNALQRKGVWKVFYQNIFYQIVGASATLRRKQEENTSSLRSKVTVLHADARKLKETFPEDSLQGFILSNRLLNTFPSHKIRKNDCGQIEVAIVVPYLISLERFRQSFPFLTRQRTTENLIRKINRENEFLKNSLYSRYEFTCSTEIPSLHQQDMRFLTKQTYQILRKLTQSGISDVHFGWKEYWVPISYFDDVLEFYKEHLDSIKLLSANQPMPLNTDLRKFQEGCGHVLKKGAQITIDCQGNNFTATTRNNGFRSRTEGNSHTYLFPPGMIDITSNVNATALAMEGIRAKFEPFLFCSNREFFSMTHYYDVINELSFHALIMNKRGTKTLFTPSVLSRPITYKDLFLAASNWSGVASPDKRCTSEKVFRITKEIFEFYKRTLFAMHQGVLTNPYQEISWFTHSTERKSPELEAAIQTLLLKLFYEQKSLFEVAREYPSLQEFNFHRIASYFTSPNTSDKTDRLIIQIVHQLLQFHYAEVSNGKLCFRISDIIISASR